MARNVAQDYAAGALKDFVRLTPGDLASLRPAGEEGQGPGSGGRPELDREALAGALREYHRGLGTLDADAERALTRLAHPYSRVVVTGQQAGLLGGPAYSVHKGVGAALLAAELDAPDAPVVPVYWVASQDHDAAEVASTTLLDLDETLHRFSLPLPQGVPVGRIPWQPEWTEATRALIGRFAAPAEYRAATLSRLNRAMEPGGSYADVFARLLHGLLAPLGVLVLDPLHPALARLMAPALARELAQPLASSARIEAAAQALEARGYEPQLRRPEGATNLFLEGDDGGRRLLRVVPGSGGKAGSPPSLTDGERSYSHAELLALLEADPSRLTPAAGLRPAVQDTLLPTLAFVVGPGEIAYGAQLREVYELHGLEQPLLWPRLSVTWLEPNVARLLRRLGASAAEVQADPAGVLGLALARERGAGAAAQERLHELRGAFTALTRELGALDPTLSGAAERVQGRSLAQIERLQGLAVRALARAEDERSGQLGRLEKHLLPGGVPQERKMNFLTYLLKHGEAPLRLLAEQSPGFQGVLEIP